MRRLATMLTTIALLAAGHGAAQADGYIGVGVGSGSELDGNIASHFSTDEETSNSRIIMGQRYGALALEASLFGTQLRSASGLMAEGDYSTLSLGVDLKYYIGLLAGLEAYGKIGVNKTWLSSASGQEDLGYEGRGNALGLGLEYTIPLPLADVGLWLDYSRQSTELRDGPREQLDGELSMVNLGVSVGF